MQFLPPAGVPDFSNAARLMTAEWDGFVHAQLEMLLADPTLRERHSFFIPDGETPEWERELVWSAFPGAIDTWFRHDPHLRGKTPQAAAEHTAETLVPMVVGYRREHDTFAPVTVYYRQQDEYCEWRAEADDDGHVQRVTFTSESPEYWAFLESVDPSLRLIASVYSEILRQTILPGELSWPYDVLVPSLAEPTGWAVRFPAHTYNPWNVHNVRQGIVHCTHPDNTLLKAATLMASASIRWATPGNQAIGDAFALVCAGGFGDPNRLSDPSIAHFVNEQVQRDKQVSVANPVGVYMRDLERGGFTTSAGDVPDWNCTRGEEDEHRMLRAVLEAPDGEHLLLDDQPVTNGGQVARRLRMTSTVLLRNRPDTEQRPHGTRPVAQCVMQPGRPGYYGVFFTGLDWPSPWRDDTADARTPTPPREPVTAPAFGPTRPAAANMPVARLDGRTLHEIASDATLDGRWSRWSRWSMLAGGVTPNRWSGAG